MANDDWVAPAVGGGLAAVVLDELFFVGPRVKTAYDNGWLQRDADLQPVIANLQAQINSLQSVVLAHERALGRVEGVAATLLVIMQELLKSLGKENIDKKELDEIVRNKVLETLTQLSAQLREARSLGSYR